MSIEPQCLYCKAVTKFRCKTQTTANACPSYKRQAALMDQLAEHRQEARERLRDEETKGEMSTVTIEKIDAAIDTLQRLKQLVAAQKGNDK